MLLRKRGSIFNNSDGDYNSDEVLNLVGVIIPDQISNHFGG